METRPDGCFDEVEQHGVERHAWGLLVYLGMQHQTRPSACEGAERLGLRIVLVPSLDGRPVTVKLMKYRGEPCIRVPYGMHPRQLEFEVAVQLGRIVAGRLGIPRARAGAWARRFAAAFLVPLPALKRAWARSGGDPFLVCMCWANLDTTRVWVRMGEGKVADTSIVDSQKNRVRARRGRRAKGARDPRRRRRAEERLVRPRWVARCSPLGRA